MTTKGLETHSAAEPGPDPGALRAGRPIPDGEFDPDRATLRRRALLIAALTAFALLVSGNMWAINSRPGFAPKRRFSERVPLFWQYDSDAGVEITSAANYPNLDIIPDRLNRRTNRPVKYAVVHAVARGLGAVTSLDIERRSMIGFIIVNTLLMGGTAWASFRFLTRYIGSTAATLAVGLWLTSWSTLLGIGLYHTGLEQFVIPALALMMFVDLAENYSHRRNIVYSILFGLLMLVKQNYAVYLAVLGFSVLNRRWKEAVLSGFVHLIPTLAWFGALKLLNMEYSNREVEQYGQGTWLFNELPHYGLKKAVVVFGGWFLKYGLMAACYYGPALLAPAAGWSRRVRDQLRLPPGAGLFLLLFIAANWLQAFASRRYEGYMTSDMAMPLFGLAGAALVVGFRSGAIRWTWGLAAGAPVVLAWVVSRAIHLPIMRGFDGSLTATLLFAAGAVAFAAAVGRGALRGRTAAFGLIALWVFYNIGSHFHSPVAPSRQLLW